MLVVMADGHGSPLFFVRPSELRGAEWAEIDFEHALWRISAERMKMRTPHIVPLCRQALELLERLQHVTGDGRYLFPAYGNPHRPMFGTRLAAALASLGFSSGEVTPHGWPQHVRSSMSSAGAPMRSNDSSRTQWGDSTRRLYNHAQYLPERTAMMQAWSDYLDGLRVSAAGRYESGTCGAV